MNAEVFFIEGPGFLHESRVFGSDKRYLSDKMKKALGIGGFPTEMPLNLIQKLPIPSVEFSETIEPFCHLFNKEIKIYTTPNSYFTTKFRDIFKIKSKAPSSYLMICGNYSMKGCPLPLFELRSVPFVRRFS